MTCHDARELFSARVDEALGADESARFDAHLADCPECRAEWVRFQQTVSLVQALEPARAPAGFVDRVLEAARPVPWYRRLVRQLFFPITIKLPVEAAAVVLVSGLAVLIFQRSPEMQKVARQEYAPVAPPASAPAPVAAPSSPPPAVPGPSGPTDERAIASSDLKKTEPLEKARALSPEPPRVAQAPARAPDEPKRPATPTPVPEVREKRAESTLADRAERDAVARASPPQVAEQSQREELQAARPDVAAKTTPAPPAPASAPRAPAAQRAAALAPPPVLQARLAAKDRTTAGATIRALIRRAGGTELTQGEKRTEVAPAGGERVEIVDASIPREHYASFMRELEQVGSVTVEGAPTAPSTVVVVRIRVTD
jgi:Putative zinc-finger